MPKELARLAVRDLSFDLSFLLLGFKMLETRIECNACGLNSISIPRCLKQLEFHAKINLAGKPVRASERHPDCGKLLNHSGHCPGGSS